MLWPFRLGKVLRFQQLGGASLRRLEARIPRAHPQRKGCIKATHPFTSVEVPANGFLNPGAELCADASGQGVFVEDEGAVGLPPLSKRGFVEEQRPDR